MSYIDDVFYTACLLDYESEDFDDFEPRMRISEEEEGTDEPAENS